jgi:anti-sigma factor RsiW
MIRKTLYGAAAIAIVMVCSIDARAQQLPNYGHGRNVTVNNYGGGYGWRGGWNNGVGQWPGSGPYDSTVAVAGIAAGASVINNIINSATVSRQPPQQVIINQGYPAYPVYPAQPVVVAVPGGYVGQTVPGGPICTSFVTGYSPSGLPVTVNRCQ